MRRDVLTISELEMNQLHAGRSIRFDLDVYDPTITALAALHQAIRSRACSTCATVATGVTVYMGSQHHNAQAWTVCPACGNCDQI